MVETICYIFYGILLNTLPNNFLSLVMEFCIFFKKAFILFTLSVVCVCCIRVATLPPCHMHHESRKFVARKDNDASPPAATPHFSHHSLGVEDA